MILEKRRGVAYRGCGVWIELLGSIAVSQRGVRNPAHHWLDGGPHAIAFCTCGYRLLPASGCQYAVSYSAIDSSGTSHWCSGVRSELVCVAFVYGLMCFPRGSLMLGGSRHSLLVRATHAGSGIPALAGHLPQPVCFGVLRCRRQPRFRRPFGRFWPKSLHHCCFGVRSGLVCVAFVYGLARFPQGSLTLASSRHFLPPTGSTD